METIEWVTLYTGDPQILRIESIEFGKNQLEYPRENEELIHTRRSQEV